MNPLPLARSPVSGLTCRFFTSYGLVALSDALPFGMPPLSQHLLVILSLCFSLSLGCWYFFVKFHNFELFLPCGIIVSLTRIKSIHGCLALYISLIMVKVAKFQQISYHDLITQWPSLSQHD